MASLEILVVPFLGRIILITSQSTTSWAVDSSIWTLTSSPDQPSSFRLYNHRANCFLGTSYRSFPDWDGLWANDTILKGLRLDLEVTCLRNAAPVASTFSVVEGK